MLQNATLLHCVIEVLTALRRDSLAALEAAKGGTQKFLERAQESPPLRKSETKLKTKLTK